MRLAASRAIPRAARRARPAGLRLRLCFRGACVGILRRISAAAGAAFHSCSKLSASIGFSSSRFRATQLIADALVARIEDRNLHRRVVGLDRKLFGNRLLALLMALEHRARPLDDFVAANPPAAPPRCRSCGRRGPARPCAGTESLSPDSLHRNVQVGDAGQQLGEFGQLVVVGCEQRLGARMGVDVLHHGPGDRQAVKGRSSPPHFVEQNQAVGAWRC